MVRKNECQNRGIWIIGTRQFDDSSAKSAWFQTPCSKLRWFFFQNEDFFPQREIASNSKNPCTLFTFFQNDPSNSWIPHHSQPSRSDWESWPGRTMFMFTGTPSIITAQVILKIMARKNNVHVYRYYKHHHCPGHTEKSWSKMNLSSEMFSRNVQ